MKKLLALLLLAAAPAFAQTVGLNAKMSAAEPKDAQHLWVSLSSTPAAASSTNLQFTAATFYGYKAATTNSITTNTATAYIGFKDTAGTIVAAGSPAMSDSITAGSYLGLMKTGAKYNLKDIYFTGTSGDKVLVVYEQ